MPDIESVPTEEKVSFFSNKRRLAILVISGLVLLIVLGLLVKYFTTPHLPPGTYIGGKGGIIISNGYYTTANGTDLQFVGKIVNVQQFNKSQLKVTIATKTANGNATGIFLLNVKEDFGYNETKPGERNFKYKHFKDLATVYNIFNRDLGKVAVFLTNTSGASHYDSLNGLGDNLTCNDKYLAALKAGENTNLDCVGYIAQMRAYK